MPFDLNQAQSHLRNLGYADNSDEMKALLGFASMLDSSGDKPPPLSAPQAIVATLGAGAQAGLARLGGADHNSAVSQAMEPLNRLTKINDDAFARSKEINAAVAKLAYEGAQTRIDRERKTKLISQIFNPPGAPAVGSPQIYSGGPAPAPFVSTPTPPVTPTGVALPAAPISATTGIAPGFAVDEATMPTASQPVTATAPVTPSANQPLPSVNQPPQTTTGAPPTTDPNIVAKHSVTEADLSGLPYSPQQIMAASLVDDKTADNMRQTNETVLKQRSQQIELGTLMTKRNEIDPARAGAIEGAKKSASERAGLNANLESEVRSNAEGARNTLQIVAQLRKMIARDPKADPAARQATSRAESAVGPWQGSSWWNSTVGNIPVIGQLFGDQQLNSMIRAATSNLELEGSKMFLKGQGAVTENERQIVRDMMGGGAEAPDAETLLKNLDRIEDVARAKLKRQDVFSADGITGVKAYDQSLNSDYLGRSGRDSAPSEPSASVRPHDEPIGATRKLTDGRTVQKTAGGWQVIDGSAP